ncbi:ABC transporter permease [Gemmatimonadota bacterium]
MTFRDQMHYAVGNLYKTRLRTFLTAFGVAIGIGAMTSMVSIGTGTQRHVEEVFNQQNILTAITVLPGRASVPGPRSGRVDPDRRGGPDPGAAPGPGPEESTGTPTASDTFPSLDAKAVELLGALPGVRHAYPVATVPGLLTADDARHFVTLDAMPPEVLAEDLESGRISLLAGRAYELGELDGVVLSRPTAATLLSPDELPETLVGRRVHFLIAQADERVGGPAAGPGIGLPPALRSLPFASLLQGFGRVGVSSVRLQLQVLGVVEGSTSFGDFLGTAVYVPFELIQPLYSHAFRDLESVLTGEVSGGQFSRVQVVADDILAVEEVQTAIEGLGYQTSSILDQLTEMRRAFVLINSFLATIGGVSLFVATMMIINTLVMAVLERRREIGLLKSLGASSNDVIRLFLTEAASIGLLGGIGGLLLGFVVARITAAIVNIQVVRSGARAVDLVAYPLWLVVGGLALAIGVSIVAGLYPARRAAQVDPVVALRQF